MTRRPRLFALLAALLAFVLSPAAAALDLRLPLVDDLLPPPAPQPAPAPAARPQAQASQAPPAPEASLPPDSGSGRRVVYGNAEQRVWLVEEDGRIARTYLVSGHTRFPKPGTYAVYSRSRFSRSGRVTMEFMVRFARSGKLGVGFHSIPVRRDGTPIQPESDLGKPVGRGCVRQSLADAAFLWDWGPEGTQVVVTP